MISRRARVFVLFTLILIVTPTVASAFPGCVDYPDLAHWLHRYDPVGWQIEYMATDGDLIVTSYYQELTLLQLSGEQEIELLGEGTQATNIRGLALADDHLYALGGSDPAQLYTWDITDPATPILSDSLYVYRYNFMMRQQEDRLYCMTSDSLKTFDISTPGAPVEVADGYLEGSAEDYLVDGDYLYAVYGLYQFVIWDISDPASPQVEGYLDDFYEYPISLAKQGDYIFAVAEPDDAGEPLIMTIDVSNPAEPMQAGAWLTPDNNWYGSDIYEVFAAGDFLYIGLWWEDAIDDHDGIMIFDIGDPLAPTHHGSLFMDQPMEFMASAVTPGLFHVSAADNGYWLLDMSSPDFARITGSKYAGVDCFGIQVVGDLAYVTTRDGELRLYDIADPADPSLINTLPLGGNYLNRIFVAGDRAYLAHAADGIAVVDVADPNSLSVLGIFDTINACDIVVADTLAYVADYDGGLRILSVNDPAAIFEVGFHPTPGNAYSLELRDEIVYVADRQSGLRILDVADPGEITELGFVDSPAFFIDLALMGDYAYLACNDEGLRVVDISNPNAPILLPATTQPVFTAVTVGVWNNYVYLVADMYGVTVYDIHDPAAPTVVGWLPMIADWGGTTLRRGIDFSDDGMLALAMGGRGIVTAGRMCDPTPVMLSCFSAAAAPGRVDLGWELGVGSDRPDLHLTASSAGDGWSVPFREIAPSIFTATDAFPGLAAGGEVVYTLTAEIAGGTIVLHRETVELMAVLPATCLHDPWPNPFNPQTALTFDLAAEGQARLRIYDVGGRLVRELAAGNFTASRHEYVWDGRDGENVEAASGVYFARLDTEAGVWSCRLIMLR